ncbi:MAG: TetR/AcrR family transcriptional regulator, partial [Lachnospiraceae bacterium]|nr:TetR/AcrR family transcriptional regulator [Lachnospiraceae bacterium]
VLPEGYKDVDLRQLYLLKDKYPKIYGQVELRLETGWETIIELLEQGIAEGCIKPVKIPILKMMLEASVEQFFRRDVLIRNKITYQDALDEVVNILMEGIKVHD